MPKNKLQGQLAEAGIIRISLNFDQQTHVLLTDRVLAPVFEAVIPMRAETQQNVARITLKTFCEAWLEHIRGRRIKFR